VNFFRFHFLSRRMANHKLFPYFSLFLLVIDSLHKLPALQSPVASSYPPLPCAAAPSVPIVANCSCGGESTFNRIYDCLLSALITVVFQVVWQKASGLVRRTGRVAREEEESDDETGGGQDGERVEAGERVLSRGLLLSEQPTLTGSSAAATAVPGKDDKVEIKLPDAGDLTGSWQQRARDQAASVRARRVSRRPS
jgi:hypothetical protein